jgi:hypothetical protein
MKQCGEIIWLSGDKVNTYCMRESGHEGKHFIYNHEPTEEELQKMKEDYVGSSNK